MTRVDSWYIDCECLDCKCDKYVRVTAADEDGDFLRLCDDCLWDEEHGKEV